MQELRSVLEKHGFHFKKQFGQNFISDGNLLRSIVEASGITKDTTVVEIGCGAGTLTRALAEAAKQVYAFDIDRDLQPVLAETLAGLDNVEVKRPKVYVAALGERAMVKRLAICERLRRLGEYVECDIVGRSLKAQMKYANKIGAAYTLIIGDNEVDSGVAQLRNMETGEQSEVALDTFTL